MHINDVTYTEHASGTRQQRRGSGDLRCGEDSGARGAKGGGRDQMKGLIYLLFVSSATWCLVAH